MAIVVNPDRVILSLVSYTEPYTSLISYTEAESAVSYLEASFSAAWTDVAVFAEVTFPDILSVDIITPTDLLTKATTKSFIDVYSGSIDAIALQAIKSLFDSVLMQDDVDIDILIAKYLVEVQNLIDTKALTFNKGTISDGITATELKVYAITKVFADSIAQPVEFVARTVNKVIADSISFTDAASAFKAFLRDFDDSIAVPDFEFYEFISGPESDAASVNDINYRGIGKNLIEGITLIDGMDGDLDFNFIKVVSELVAPLDAKVVDFNSTKADNVLTSSSGILAMQDYCDITYFLEDYVGLSRAFT